MYCYPVNRGGPQGSDKLSNVPSYTGSNPHSTGLGFDFLIDILCIQMGFKLK